MLFSTLAGVWTQLRPPPPAFTEKDVPSLVGKVFIVTGGNAGLGFELIKMLYSKGGTVYMAGRNPKLIDIAVQETKSAHPTSHGQVKSLIVDLNDLTTISPCVSKFLAQESRLDVLWNNAGITQIPPGSISAQGHQANMGVNCLGHHLLTKLLLPVLLRTAESSPKASVRVVFTSSGAADVDAPPGGMVLADLAPGKHSQDPRRNYSSSKVGNWFQAYELDKRTRKNGLVCLTQTPGTLRTKGWDNASWLIRFIFSPFFHTPKMGAYTELWAGLSPEVTCDDGGRFGIPFGRWHPSLRPDFLESLKTEDEGGTGVAAKFWDWCEEQTKEYAGIGS